MKVWLVGMMGSGKTTSGSLAASHLGVPFVDMDRMIEERVGVTIPSFWAGRGEAAFRQLERSIVAELEHSDGIVATGGGVVLDAANRAVLSRSGLVVWLDAGTRELADRVAGSADRPLLARPGAGTESVLERTREERAHLYLEVADHRIPTDALDVEAVADRIEDLWKSLA